jgi:predicted DNA binding CopG/RHH family protein
MKAIPEFSNEAEERAFWEERDSTEFIDWSRAENVRLPNLKKTTKSISIRLPVDMIERIKTRANALDVPYQSLIKIMLQEQLQKEH